jgi:hypothetical protein
MNEKIYEVPYIEHEYRMYKAYKREKKLKIMLGVSNLIWASIVAVILFAR